MREQGTPKVGNILLSGMLLLLIFTMPATALEDLSFNISEVFTLDTLNTNPPPVTPDWGAAFGWSAALRVDTLKYHQGNTALAESAAFTLITLTEEAPTPTETPTPTATPMSTETPTATDTDTPIPTAIPTHTTAQTPQTQPTAINPRADINEDGVIDSHDMLLMMLNWHHINP